MSILTSVRDIKRLQNIIAILIRHGFGHVVERLNFNDNFILRLLQQRDPDAERLSIGRRMYLLMLDLGPTFIKLGQLLSTRSDLLPADILQELKGLQDNTAPTPFAKVREVIEYELGKKLEEVFTEFSETPLASASIGQVHQALLKSGDKVVVKVQHPGIKEIIASDLEILQQLAKLIEMSIPESRLFQPVGIVEEFDRAIIRELDFTHEASNATRLRGNFALETDVEIPYVHSQFSTTKILTLSLVDGVKITDFAKVNATGEYVARLILRAIFKQIFEDGFFHADPHPGNLYITRTHKLAFLDLGQMGKLSDQLKDQILFLMLSIVKQDREGVASLFYDVGIKGEKVDIHQFRHDVDDLLDNLIGRELEQINFGVVLRELMVGAARHKMKIPTNFTLMCKSIITLESVVRDLHPSLNVFEELKPYIFRLIAKRWSAQRFSQDFFRLFYQLNNLSQTVPFMVQDLVDSLRRGDLTIKVEEKGSKRMLRMLMAASTRVTLGIVFSGMFLGSSLVYAKNSTLGTYGLICTAAVGAVLGILLLMPKSGG